MSLKSCLGKYKIEGAEAKRVLSFYKNYIKDKYDPKDAGKEAVNEYLVELNNEKDSILKQIQAKVPEFGKEQPKVEIFRGKIPSEEAPIKKNEIAFVPINKFEIGDKVETSAGEKFEIINKSNMGVTVKNLEGKKKIIKTKAEGKVIEKEIISRTKPFIISEDSEARLIQAEKPFAPVELPPEPSKVPVQEMKIFRMTEDTKVTNVKGKEITLPKDEEYRTYDLGNGKTRLQDGQQVTVYEGELNKLKGQVLPKGEQPMAGGILHKLEPYMNDFQKENIAWEPKKIAISKESIKDLLANIYTKFVMSEYPIIRLAQKAGKREFVDLIENQVRRNRGLGGVANEMLVGKGVRKYGEMGKETELVEGSKSLKDILSPLKTRIMYMDYEGMRVAERYIALAKYRPDVKIKEGIVEQAQAELNRLESKYGTKFEEFKNISKEHREFEEQAILKPLLDIGWLSKEGYEAIINAPESKYYASFSREMDTIEQSFGGKEVLHKIKGSERMILPSTEATIKNLMKTVKLVETQKLNKEVVGLRELTPDLAETIQEIKGTIGTKSTIIVAEEGIKRHYTVPEDVRKALDYYSPKEMSTVMKIMGMPARLLRAGATLTVEFIARNPIRDQFSAFVYSKYGYMPITDFPKGLFHLLKKDDLYHEFSAAGGEQAYFVAMDRTSANLRTKDIVGYAGRGWKTYNPIEALRMWSEYMEKATRIGLYAKAKAKGATSLEAMAEARESTVDFGRMGTEGRAINQIIAFWNANIQGLDIARRRIFSGENAGKNLLKATMGITMPSILLWLNNKDNERYKEIPEWQKNLFWIIPIKDGPIIRIPKPFELGIIFGSLPERILDYIYKNDPKELESLITAVGSGASPGLIPTAISPIVENMTNYSFFLDRQIENTSMKQLPPGMRSMSYTSKIAKETGKLTNISPLKIDNMLRGWTGGLGQYALNLAGMGMGNKIPEVGKHWYETMPGIKGLLAKEPLGTASESVNRFFDNYEKIIEADRGYKVLRETGRTEEAREFLNKNRRDIYMASSVRKVARRLSFLRKSIMRIQESPNIDSITKRQKIDRLQKRMTIIAEKYSELP